MKTKSFVYYLDDSLAHRIRETIKTEEGRVTGFSIQYEAHIGASWQAIVRFDTAHGYAHKDICHPDGTREKQLQPWRDFAHALTSAENDLKARWSAYLDRYREEWQKTVAKGEST